MMEHTTTHDDALCSDDLTREYGWPLSNQKRARKQGKFPPSYQIGRRNFWRRSTIEAWFAEQEAKTAQQVTDGNDDVAS